MQQITFGDPGTLPVAAHCPRMRDATRKAKSKASRTSNAAQLIRAQKDTRDPDPLCANVPTVEDGRRGLSLVEGRVESSRKDRVWTKASLDL